jgi:hypothetical protein
MERPNTNIEHQGNSANTLDELTDIAKLLLNQKSSTSPTTTSSRTSQADDHDIVANMHPLGASSSSSSDNIHDYGSPEFALAAQLRQIAQEFLSQSDFQAADVWIQKSRCVVFPTSNNKNENNADTSFSIHIFQSIFSLSFFTPLSTHFCSII